jgi:hypothetical protein
MSSQRTMYDMYMLERYNTYAKLSNTQLPSCISCHRRQEPVEMYEPVVNFRRPFDTKLQMRWPAPECSTFNDPNLSPWSYKNAPY